MSPKLSFFTSMIVGERVDQGEGRVVHDVFANHSSL